MSEHREGESAAYRRIQGTQTLGEALEVAASFEKSAWDFYRELAPKVSKRIRYLVEELAGEEQGHYQRFLDIAQRTDLQEQIQQRIQSPASDHRFSDCIQIPDLGDHPDDQTILQYALGREQAAMEQYRALADQTAAGPLKELFEFLAGEELEHKQELEKRYYELVHAGQG